MNQYSKYKSSGIEWIGKIPSHWTVRYLQIIATKEQYSFTGGPFGSDLKSNEYTKDGVRIIQLQNIGIGEFLDDYRIYTSEEKADELFSCNIFPGEVIVAKMADPVARACLIPNQDKRYLMASDGIRIKVSNSIANSKYVVYSMNSPYFSIQAEQNSEGTTRLRIGLGSLRKLKFILPPVTEQTAIATYLDRKTAEIDELIADKKRLLELYEEEKIAIINQAVTKGINPNVPMKDSGIEWLGEIPEKWGVKRLKTIARVQTGRTPKILNSQVDFFENGDINWFTPSDFDGNSELIDSKRKLIAEAFETGEVELFSEYSIYLVSIGATLGKVSFFREKASANQQINIIIFHQTFNPLFGHYFLVGNKEMITLEADYTTLPILNQSKTKSLFFAVPPFEEQQSIVHHIETECARIDAKKSKTEKLIDLLTEYRTALISEVVTGKVNVIE